MEKADIFVRIATQGLIGFGIAPGTIATLLVVPLVWFLGGLGLSAHLYFLVCMLFLFAGVQVVHRALPAFESYDPSAIVIDEMVCFLFVFVGIPITLPTLIIGFGLFRFFDIVKPFGIAELEKLPGVCGVMQDDLAAAIVSNVLLLGMQTFGFM